MMLKHASLLLLAAMALLSGCASDGAYKTGETFDPNIHTVAVPIFANRSFFRETEFQLSEALIKEIESRTPYKVTRGSDADTMLTGTIVRVDKRLLSRDFDSGVTQEAQVVITASIEWKDLRTGKIIRKRSSVVGAAEYVPRAPVGEPEEVARYGAVSELAREIVSVMRNDW
ncbi:MAG: hypothetical protein GC162_15315 [Planctomycetes bacterium]|nr:hypothetical protein [Planctomycetota bacterium]